MNARYENPPYFAARLAACMEVLGAWAICARLLHQIIISPYSWLRLIIIPDQGIFRAARNRRQGSQQKREQIRERCQSQIRRNVSVSV